MQLSEMLTFIRQTTSNYRAVGTAFPSGPFLARAMARCIPTATPLPDDFRVLEAGSGTGAITAQIVRQMRGAGMLDLCEISPSFAQYLRDRIQREPLFSPMQSRITVHCCDVRHLRAVPTYDAVIASLPFSNFTPAEVNGFLEHFRALTKPGGTFTFVEFIAVRRLMMTFGGQEARQRLQGVNNVVGDFTRNYIFRREVVVVNVLPSWVRHLRFTS